MSKTTVLVTAVILIFIVAVAYALFHLGEVNKQEVVNRYYGSEFSFTYPLGYELQEYNNNAFSIGATSQDGFASAVDLTMIPIPAETQDIPSYIREQLMVLCAADGPAESISCPAIASEEQVKTVAGENASLYFLTLTREVMGQPTETRSYGPLYVYIVSSDDSDGSPVFSALVVHHPLPTFMAGTADTQLLTRINDSIRIGETRR